MLLSNHYEMRYVPINKTAAAPYAPIFSDVRGKLAGNVAISKDRKNLIAIYPVLLQALPNEIRPSRVGILFIEYDLTRAKQEAYNDALKRSLVFNGTLIVFCLGLWFFFEITLTRRVSRLVSASNSLAEGNLNVRAGLSGSDELTQISVAFDRMASKIQENTRELHRQNAILKAQQEASIDGISIVDENRKIVSYNQRICELWHIPIGMVETGNDRQLMEWFISNLEDPDRLLNRLEYLYQNPTEIGQGELLLKDGHIFDYYSASVRSPLGDNYGRIWYFRDITERKEAETILTETNQKLAIYNEELARATRLKDEFLANMSHELRTPLNGILGMTEGLEENVFGAINSEQREALQIIRSSGEHLLELINDILDLGKIEAGQIELRRTPTAINQVCQSSISFIKQQSLKKSIQLEVNIPSNLPKLSLDERRIQQVLINLLSNAVKFTPAGGRITLDVTIEQAIGGQLNIFSKTDVESNTVFSPLSSQTTLSSIKIAVSDTGIGIAPENLRKLFKPFIQIDGALNRQYAGTGLGLSLVKRMVELHGGKVGVTSEVGAGSCFTINLPYQDLVIQSPELVSAVPGSLEQDYIERFTKTSPLILLAEDDEVNISTICNYLEAKGYRIVLAKNGQEAINLTKLNLPDLILMDIQMPGIDGLEAIRQIRCDRKLLNIPIIALTALAMTGDREKCLEAGANEYLSKPLKLKQMVTRIEHILVEKDVS
ncbi:response regulator [Symplocastrum sp. BBK-W-15]|uniref:Circadian input-output histidine kinase CikA n=1 Tax=Limnofasciculus baicalensis BBK-W-15 TaxID=2699891 RepID=A0AAE3GU99_9CYAN|nr:response regulator [Limnofasciculus baicalensis]MCP2730781.1 response regulator [Limnofasciculus baicalensis BBK-W-15]